MDRGQGFPEQRHCPPSAKLLNPPNLLVPGSYDIIYEVTDLRGLSTSVARTVEVIATPPALSVTPGKYGSTISNGNNVLFYQVMRKNLSYPVADEGPFQILSQPSSDFPNYLAQYYDGSDLTDHVKVINAEKVDYSLLNQETTLNLSVGDFALRQANLPSGDPVSTSINLVVKVVDSLPPILSVSDGFEQDSPMRVEGVKYNVSGISLVPANGVDFARDLDPG